MIKIRYEYWCDFCPKEVVGADVHEHGAEWGRYPQPRSIFKVGGRHACQRCVRIAEDALAAAPPP